MEAKAELELANQKGNTALHFSVRRASLTSRYISLYLEQLSVCAH